MFCFEKQKTHEFNSSDVRPIRLIIYEIFPNLYFNFIVAIICAKFVCHHFMK